jgi:hypothetical protein
MISLTPSYTFTPMAAGPNLTVMGGGTLGRLTKWTGFTSSNSFIGDSTIFESKLGLVGIGTDAPTSRLTVAGLIETTLGGYKFPDGSVQTTALNANQVVRSLNGLTGDVQLAAGANITITPAGNTLTIAGAGGPSPAYHAISNPDMFINLQNPGVDVISKQVPAVAISFSSRSRSPMATIPPRM